MCVCVYVCICECVYVWGVYPNVFLWLEVLFLTLFHISHIIYNHHRVAAGQRKITLLDYQLQIVRGQYTILQYSKL